MKRILAGLVVSVFIWSGYSFAAGKVCTVTPGEKTYLLASETDIVVVEVNCTADDADAAFDATSVVERVGGWLVAYEFIPGTTAPTTLMDLTLLNADGHDVLGGNGSDIVTTTTTKRPPLDSDSNSFPAEVFGDLTPVPTGNSVNSATFKLKLYFMK